MSLSAAAEEQMLRSSLLQLVDNMVDTAPDEAFDRLITREVARTYMHRIIKQLGVKDLTKETILCYKGLDRILGEVVKDWMLERSGLRSKYPNIRAELRKLGMTI